MLAFFSMVDRRKKLHHEVMERLRAERNDVLDTAIPASADVERMGVKRDAIGVFAPRGRAAPAYEALWTEVRQRVEG